MQDDFAMVKRLAIIADQPLFGQWEQAIQSGVDELIRCSSLLVEEMRQCSVGQHIFAPNHRIPQQEHLLGVIDSTKPAPIKPAIFAEAVRDPVIWPGL